VELNQPWELNQLLTKVCGSGHSTPPPVPSGHDVGISITQARARKLLFGRWGSTNE